MIYSKTMALIEQTKYKAKSIGNVKGLGEIFELSAPLDEQIKAFQNEGIAYPYLATPK